MESKFISKKTLDNLYTKREMNLSQISRKLNCSRSQVSRMLKKHGIEIRKFNRKYNLIGKKFGILIILEPLPHSLWSCICDCGNLTTAKTSHLRQGRRQSCGCLKHRKGNKSPKWRGYEEISKHLYLSYRHSANRREIPFKITLVDMWNQYIKQDKKCALTGLQLTMQKMSCHNNGDASLDRIDSKKGYTPDNIQWVHKIVNQLKWDNSNEELIYWCGLIHNYNLSK